MISLYAIVIYLKTGKRKKDNTKYTKKNRVKRERGKKERGKKGMKNKSKRERRKGVTKRSEENFLSSLGRKEKG